MFFGSDPPCHGLDGMHPPRSRWFMGTSSRAILLFRDDRAPPLADFGAARLASRAGHAFTVRGTLYLAPECWADPGRQSQASDASAFGDDLAQNAILLARLLTNFSPRVRDRLLTKTQQAPPIRRRKEGSHDSLLRYPRVHAD